MKTSADILSEITNTTVSYTSPSPDIYSDVLTKAGVPGEYVGMFVGFGAAIEQGEFYAEKSDLEKLLGRKPISLQEFLKQTYIK